MVWKKKLVNETVKKEKHKQKIKESVREKQSEGDCRNESDFDMKEISKENKKRRVSNINWHQRSLRKC